MEWISVEERLPDRGGPYLYYCPHDEDYLTDWGVATYFWDGLWGTGCSDRITHWMPLPDPPTEGTDLDRQGT